MYLALESEFQDYTTTDDIDLVNNIFKNMNRDLRVKVKKKLHLPLYLLIIKLL